MEDNKVKVQKFPNVSKVPTSGDECTDGNRVIRVSSKKYQKEPKRIKKEQLKVTKKVAKN